MRTFSDQTHYEILDLTRDVTAEQIERGYRLARATYAPGSLATYSLYEEAELTAMQERIELAYSVLSDAAQRQAYDVSLGESPQVELALSFADVDDREIENTPEIRGFEESEYGGPFDGARLRRWRIARGIELDRIAATTKISASYLRSLEDEQFESLPAAVYVRGFLTSYLRCVGLDAERVVPSYMERVLAARPAKALRPSIGRGAR